MNETIVNHRMNEKKQHLHVDGGFPKKVVIKGRCARLGIFSGGGHDSSFPSSPWHPQEEKENLIRAKTVLAGM